MERLTEYESIAGHVHAIPIVSDMDAIPEAAEGGQKMKIYMAGKITGDPNYKMKFSMTAKHIQELYPLAVILNPAELPEGLTPKDYMRLCFGMIDAADILFALPDAKESKGAKLEIAYCRYVGKEVLEWND